MTHTIDATGGDVAASRWVEMRRDATDALGEPWTTFQEGAYQPDTDDRWMGSIAMDAAGNIAVGYSVSSLTTNPAVRYTARKASDPLNTMRDEQILVAGTGVNTSTSNRWGDYSVMTVDPEDDCTFWFFEEYMAVTGASTYATRIGSFKFDDCTSATIFNDGFESGDTSRWDTVAN
jgi:isoaspartyl peptidase/L-asparaginase-like protein (Ntn-hydrolase superfamily)